MKYIAVLFFCMLLVISGNSLVISYQNTLCKQHQFQCKNNQCIEEEFLCDGKADCIDQSDETSNICSTITCPRFAFRCHYGACIHRKDRCNQIQNCLDNSDESSCSTSGKGNAANSLPSSSKRTSNKKQKAIKGKYICQSGEIIDEELLCDGQPNCLDNSDETYKSCSTIFCPYYTFRCAYGACIKLSEKLNGVQNCIDGSDERISLPSKSPTITTSEPPTKTFQCNSGKIINQELVCDGEPNCDDFSDETAKECSQLHCPSFSYRCHYGACILGGAMCNEIKECADNSDESVCGATTLNFGTVSEIKKFQCKSGQVINAELVCDGKADCTDFSDEALATCSQINCPHFAYKCNYGGCVHGTARCNGIKECLDNSDEAFCPAQNQTITKSNKAYNDYLIFS